MKNVFTFLLLLFSLLCNGQSPKLFTTDKELSSSLINQIYQDRNGFIWIATEDGLNRYDGAKFTIYKHEPNNEHSLAHNFVRTVFEDSKGHLLIGTYIGIQMYDPATDNFTPLAKLEDTGETLESNINSFIERKKRRDMGIRKCVVQAGHQRPSVDCPESRYCSHFTRKPV